MERDDYDVGASSSVSRGNPLCLNENEEVKCVKCGQLFIGLFERFCSDFILTDRDNSILKRCVIWLREIVCIFCLFQLLPNLPLLLAKL